MAVDGIIMRLGDELVKAQQIRRRRYTTRGKRARDVGFSGFDMYGQPVHERITIWIDWRRAKRISAKMDKRPHAR